MGPLRGLLDAHWQRPMPCRSIAQPECQRAALSLQRLMRRSRAWPAHLAQIPRRGPGMESPGRAGTQSNGHLRVRLRRPAAREGGLGAGVVSDAPAAGHAPGAAPRSPSRWQLKTTMPGACACARWWPPLSGPSPSRVRLLTVTVLTPGQFTVRDSEFGYAGNCQWPPRQLHSSAEVWDHATRPGRPSESSS